MFILRLTPWPPLCDKCHKEGVFQLTPFSTVGQKGLGVSLKDKSMFKKTLPDSIYLYFQLFWTNWITVKR